ncbi:MAG: DUF2752 domain-containing protein [Myxococcaceae bacterium]|nr:DUF2752 domain-containing protein [Myxococcaceae bacterium]
MQLVLPRPNRTLGTIDALGIIGLVGLLIGRYVPVALIIPFWGCTFRETTGIPCPGCGLTRVADRVAHFNVTGAFMANPLGTVVALLFAVAVVLMVVHLVFGVPIPELQLSDAEWRVVRWVAVGLFFANYGFVVFAYRVLHWR